MKFTGGCFLFFGIITSLCLVSDARAQNLEETLVRAYQKNPILRAERARLRATDEGVPQALSGWRPTVQVDSSAGWERSDSTTSGLENKKADISEPVTATVTITQNLYRGGRTFAATQEAENNVKADRARLSSVEQSVLLSAATAYADVVRDQAVLGLNRNNERVLQRQLEATQDRFSVGELTRTEVSQAESRLSSARAELIAAEGSLADSRASYENIVGVLPQVLAPAEPLSALPASLVEAVERAKTRNFSVIQTKFIGKAADDNVKVITGELLPTITLSGSAQASEETSTPRSESQTLSVTARVSIPLYASGSVTSRVRAAKQLVSQRRDEFDQAVRDAVKLATSAWQSLETGRAQIRAFRATVKAAQIALEGVKEEANVGSRTILEVLDAEQELLNARVGLLRAMRDEMVATYRLRQSVGDLTAAKLGLPVDLYNPEIHYRHVRRKWWGLNTDSGQ